MGFLGLIILFFSQILSAMEVAPIGDIAKSLNLISMMPPNSKWAYPGVSRFYSDPRLERIIMAVEKIPGTRKGVVLKPYPRFTLLEFPETETTYTSVALVNIPSENIHKFIKKKSVFFLIYDLLIPKAYGTTECRTEGIKTSLDQLAQYYSSEYIDIAWNCLLGVLNGVWDSTGGAVTDMAKEITSLVSDPSGYWNKKVENIEKLKLFFSKIEENMQKIYEQVGKLSATAKAHIFCSFVGGLSTDLLIGFFTGGMTISHLSTDILKFTQKITRLIPLLDKFSSLGKIDFIPKDFFERLTRGAISDETLDSISALTKHDLDNMALGLMKCSL